MNDLAGDFSILWPALVAGILVVLSHVPLGQQVLRRGIVFIDLAIAQVAGLGVIAAQTFGTELQGWRTQAAAVAAALLGALLLTWTERKRPEVQEAMIGVLFVLASTAQILLLANNPHGGEELKDLLAGQILWVFTWTRRRMRCICCKPWDCRSQCSLTVRAAKSGACWGQRNGTAPKPSP